MCRQSLSRQYQLLWQVVYTFVHTHICPYSMNTVHHVTCASNEAQEICLAGSGPFDCVLLSNPVWCMINSFAESMFACFAIPGTSGASGKFGSPPNDLVGRSKIWYSYPPWNFLYTLQNHRRFRFGGATVTARLKNRHMTFHDCKHLSTLPFWGCSLCAPRDLIIWRFWRSVCMAKCLYMSRPLPTLPISLYMQYIIVFNFVLVGCDRRRIIALDTRNGTHQVLHESNEIIRISCLSPKSGDIISSLVNQQHGYLSNFFIFHWIWHVKTLCVSDILTFYDILTCYDVSTFFIRKFSLCSRDHQDEWL